MSRLQRREATRAAFQGKCTIVRCARVVEVIVSGSRVRRRGRVRLVRQGLSAGARRLVLAADGPLDRAGRSEAAMLAGLPVSTPLYRSPSAAAGHTVQLARWPPAVVDPALRDREAGGWAGRTVHELADLDPDGLRRWLKDPEFAPPGGESLVDVQRRAVNALTVRRDGNVVCVTHGVVIKAVVLYALSAPLVSLSNIDVAACSVTELRTRPDGGWTVAYVNRRGLHERPLTVSIPPAGPR